MADWKNRIVGHGVKPADQFLAHPKNARMHPQFQRDVMRSALDTVGFVAPVIESVSGFLLDGHERVWQGLQNDNADIPFVTVDVTEDEEAYVLATFDPITSLANYESELLGDLLQDVQGNNIMGSFLDQFFNNEPSDTLETSRQLDKPKVSARTAAKREFVSGLKREALATLIPELPPPDTDLYIVGNGNGAETRHGISSSAFDFGSFVPVIVEYMGNVDCTAYISTWTMNRQHAKTFIQMLDDKRLSSLSILTGLYFKQREQSVFAELVMGLQEHGQRYLASRNHCKIIAIQAPDGQTCVITGSANLSAQLRCEQYVLTTSPDVYQFFATEFFEALFNAG